MSRNAVALINKQDTEIVRYKIIVIQSLCQGDLRTGENLYDGTLKWRNMIRKDVASEFHNVFSKEEYHRIIEQISDSLESGDVLTLQIDTHGSPDGISFSNGDVMKWKEFHDSIRVLNERIGGMLIVCLAMCYGGATISTIDHLKRAPYRAIVAPFKEVPAKAIEDGFTEFYQVYNNALDLFSAIKKLQDNSIDDEGKPYFEVLTAEQIFDMTFDPDRDPEHFRDMIRQICIEKYKNLDPENLMKLDADTRAMLKAATSHRDHYLFKDLYGETK